MDSSVTSFLKWLVDWEYSLDRETKIQIKVKFPYIITLMINRWMLRLVVRGTRWIKTVEKLLRWDKRSTPH